MGDRLWAGTRTIGFMKKCFQFNDKIIILRYIFRSLYMKSPLSLPSFTMYPLNMNSSKMCYQSESQTLMCSVGGPYFPRNKTSLEPSFNISISSSIKASQVEENLPILTHQLKSILSQVLLQERYLRMEFDIAFDVVEGFNVDVDVLLCAMINLLSFTFLVLGVEIKSMFSCSCVWFVDGQIYTKPPEKTNNVTKMVMAVESVEKDAIFGHWGGGYNFIQFQKLSNALLDLNQEIQKYLTQKINELHSNL